MIAFLIFAYLVVGIILAFIHCYSMTGDCLEEFLGMVLVWLPVWIIKASYGSVRLILTAMSGA
jgi:hypothetical protein